MTTLAAPASGEATALDALRAAAEVYARALHRCDLAALGGLFAPEAHLYAVEGGEIAALPRDAWLARVAERQAPPEAEPAEYTIGLVDASGPETGLVRLDVRVGERRFTDYLLFLRTADGWRVIAKAYRLSGAAGAVARGRA